MTFMGGVPWSLSLWAQQSEELPREPNSEDRDVTGGMIALLDALHLTQHPLDDEISERAFDTFVDNLDPAKVYFTHEDIAEFKKNRKRLDDYAKRGDVKFAYQVFHRFLDRVDERVKLVNELLT